MKNYIDTILQEIKRDRTTGAVEPVKKGKDIIALFISHLNLNLNLYLNLSLNLDLNLNLRVYS